MALPTSYTEKTLADYMDARLGPVADALAWTVGVADPGSYAEMVNEALTAYGVSDVTTITGLANLAKLRALAEVALWRAVVFQTAGDFDFSADGGSYSRSQIHAQAKEALALAEQRAVTYAPEYVVGVDAVRLVHDPYTYLPDEERDLP